MNILKVQNLSCTYERENIKFKTLDDVTFSVDKGEFTAIVGHSGAGKSALMYSICGFNKPTYGTILIEGTDIYELSDSQLSIFRRRNIGQLNQFYNLFPELNVEENITIPLFMDGRRAEKSYLDEVINILELGNERNLMPSKLSKWEVQKVYIGRALITKPAIILADEPTGNLDIINSNKVMDILKYFNTVHDQTILLCTHDEKISMKASRAIILDKGHIYKEIVLK
ncbi:MAG: ABC transporter ATP-binding protein [Oscillospiraceae bacterium]|nr:ABC transporter ATP-binding protein [Oscillospiraceae bacterium]